MTRTSPHRPDRPGAAFLEWLDAAFELDPVERVLATSAAAAIDHIIELRSRLSADGLVVAGSKGQPRAHPALAEIRAELETFRRLVADLALPTDAAPAAKLRAAR